MLVRDAWADLPPAAKNACKCQIIPQNAKTYSKSCSVYNFLKKCCILKAAFLYFYFSLTTVGDFFISP